jgi:hypothetical protein
MGVADSVADIPLEYGIDNRADGSVAINGTFQDNA